MVEVVVGIAGVTVDHRVIPAAIITTKGAGLVEPSRHRSNGRRVPRVVAEGYRTLGPLGGPVVWPLRCLMGDRRDGNPSSGQL